MPRHRTPPSAHHSLATLVLTGAAVGASLIHPLTATATPAGAAPTETQPRLMAPPADEADGFSDGDRTTPPRHRAPSRDRVRPDNRPRAEHRGDRTRARDASRNRPMTSGERQYRNGCRQGYINQGCDGYDVPHLLRRGINPFL